MNTAFLLSLLLAQTPEQPVRAVPDPGVVTTRQTITPAGVPAVFQGRVYGVAFGASAEELWVLGASHVYQMEWRNNRVRALAAHGGTAGLQSLQYDRAGNTAWIATSRQRRVRLQRAAGGTATVVAENLGGNLAGALAVGGGKALVPLTADNKLVVVDVASGKVLGTVDTGTAPFGAVIDAKGTTAWISNWGGRRPQAGDRTAPTGHTPGSDVAVVDARGIAASGTVQRVDLNSLKVTASVATGLHPTGLAWDEARHRLYVANGNSDSVSVVDTAKAAVARTIEVQPFAQKVTGIAPTAVAVSADGAKVFAACGGINAVAQIEAATGRVMGLIPTAWYPNALALSGDGKYLAVGALLGAGSGWREAPSKRYVHANRGAIAVVPLPDDAQLASYTGAVAENNHLSMTPLPPATPSRTPRAIPLRAGDPSPIQHVVFIIKENRTYDQLFGDLPRGNGDPSLVLFGEDVTPNQRRLAQQFVVFDNFYATGGNSADGHQWVTQANEVAYCLWPGYQGRSYPFDGTDPLAYANSGFLWDQALARGKSVRVYGEYAGRLAEPAQQRIDLLNRWKKDEDFSGAWNITAPIEALNKILAHNYPSYTNGIPDVIRTQIFLKDLAAWEKSGTMPHLTIVQLPSDHTYGTAPGASTPKAMVADNDLAVGQMVEALTKSRFWPKMAIFVVEDDAQNGVDHVDGHRTVALVVSPYARREHVDSTFYSHQSMLKSIELILGLPTLSLFDLIAHDMRASFQETPDLTPYTAVVPKQDLLERNPAAAALRGEARRAALRSAQFRWDVPDAAPTGELNRILWHSIRGWGTPYPGVKQAVFSPLTLDIDDDER